MRDTQAVEDFNLLLRQLLHETLGTKSTEDRNEVNKRGGAMAQRLRKQGSVLMAEKSEMVSDVHAVIVMNG